MTVRKLSAEGWTLDMLNKQHIGDVAEWRQSAS